MQGRNKKPSRHTYCTAHRVDRPTLMYVNSMHLNWIDQRGPVMREEKKQLHLIFICVICTSLHVSSEPPSLSLKLSSLWHQPCEARNCTGQLYMNRSIFPMEVHHASTEIKINTLPFVFQSLILHREFFWFNCTYFIQHCFISLSP